MGIVEDANAQITRNMYAKFAKLRKQAATAKHDVADVVIRKEESPMPTSALQLAEDMTELRRSGRMSDHKFAKMRTRLAAAMFPGEKSEAAQLAKFFKTREGQATLSSGPRLPQAAEIDLRKAEGSLDDDYIPTPGQDAEKRTSADDGSPHYAELKRLAGEQLKRNPKLSEAQAFDAALATSAGAASYAAHKAWMNAQRA